jgi:hypothetical protein
MTIHVVMTLLNDAEHTVQHTTAVAGTDRRAAQQPGVACHCRWVAVRFAADVACFTLLMGMMHFYLLVSHNIQLWEC